MLRPYFLLLANHFSLERHRVQPMSLSFLFYVHSFLCDPQLITWLASKISVNSILSFIVTMEFKMVDYVYSTIIEFVFTEGFE